MRAKLDWISLLFPVSFGERSFLIDLCAKLKDDLVMEGLLSYGLFIVHYKENTICF